MSLVRGNVITNYLESIIHEETQLHDDRFDLTINKIRQLTEAGSLDFGGSEFQPAEGRTMDPQKKNENDDYGWWHLRRGTYQAIMNETVTDLKEKVGIIAPHDHLRQTGIVATTSIVTSPKNQSIILNFTVPEAGCNIKENARFATLFLLDTE